MPKRRALLVLSALASFLPFVSGCLGVPETAAAGESGALRLMAEVAPADEYGEHVLRWAFENGGGAPVEIGCGDADYCEVPPYRVEAEQSDGSWVERDSIPHLYGFLDEADAHRSVSPSSVVSFHHPSTFKPGTFRAIVRVATPAGPVDVAREVAVVGWSDAQLERARDILRRAEAASCGTVSRNVYGGMLYRTEPDVTLDLLAEADSDERRDTVRWTMLDRGNFALELAEEVQSMSRSEVGEFATSVERRDARSAGPVREALAARLVEYLDDFGAPIAVSELRSLEAFAAHWPEHAIDTFIVRLGDGPDQGEQLIELINVIAYARPDDFRSSSARILSALEARCAGANGALADACGNAVATFSSEYLLGARGFGGSWGCGGAIHLRVGICSELATEWGDLEAEPMEVVVLGGSVLPVATESAEALIE